MLQPGCWQGSASPAAATAAPSPALAEREAAWTPSVAGRGLLRLAPEGNLNTPSLPLIHTKSLYWPRFMTR